MTRYSTPLDAPLVPRFPVGYRDVSVLTACYRTDPAAIDALLPAPLQRLGDVVMVHVYDMPDVDHFGAVRECNVMVGAQLDAPGEPGHVAGGFSVALLIDSDMGLALGREVHGQPKKLGSPRLEQRGDLTVATVRRNGIDVITATTPYKRQRASLDELNAHFPFAENLNLKLIPQIDGTPALAQITARKLADVRVHECWRGPGTVELRANAQVPVWRLPVREPLDAFCWRADFTLAAGRIVHDLLSEHRENSPGRGDIHNV
ncbi:MAG TPA: acetoacetate decarboxylase [Conexibacter sp.]|nr:acetoacetate decarboxylase [Conexibacter sp.]